MTGAIAAVLAARPAPGAALEPLRLVGVGEFRQPVHATGPGAAPRALYVLERGGRVWRVAPGGKRRPFLDARRFVRLLSPRNQRRDQGGAFSLAFGPRYRRGGAVYMLYTRRDGRIHLDEFRPRGAHPPPPPRTMVSVPRRSRIDVGGHIEFGPDGLLYASLGFGRRPESSQDPNVLLGKVLRIDPRAPERRPEVFASGLRVPWRFSFDPPTGRLVVADVGESAFEEINVLPLLGGTAPNLGWPFFEGRRRRLEGGPANAAQPALAVPHGPRMCAIVGGYVVRTPAPARLRRRYLYGDVCSGQLRSVRLGRRRAFDDRSEHTVVPYLVSFGRDGGGRLYAVSLDGRVFRVG